MTVSPLPTTRAPRPRTVQAGQPRRAVPAADFARRRAIVVWSKRILPIAAALLLASIALWPELSSLGDGARISYRRGGLTADLDAGRLTDARYRGQDARGRPYTITATTATQNGPERVDLTQPKGDVVTESGAWLMVEAQSGVYQQHGGQLDLSGDATLWRDDGITVRSPAVSVDAKQGAAASNEMTHAEGPFGTLDSQGFALVDKGSVLQFQGPSRLVLNGTSH